MADIITKATRMGYAEGLLYLGETDEKVVVLDADLAGATQTAKFKQKHPDRFFDCGIAEQNMIGIASGYEQIRNSVGYPHLNVKIGATHGGISVGEDGASHQCNEDIALMRTIPGMTIINPADAVEAKAATIAAAKYDGPVYMRFGRLAVPVIFDRDYKFEWGKAQVLTEGNDVAIVATGLMVNEALMAAEQLKNDGISARVINVHTIKPLDEECIIHAARECGCVVTAEEHNVIGGLGGAVCETLSENCPTPVLRVGVDDEFGRSGPAVELLHLYGLDAAHIVEAAKKAITLK